MVEFYNEMLIRNVDCGYLYFQIKDDELIKEYEDLKKEKTAIENNYSLDEKRLVEINGEIEELSKEIFSFNKNIEIPKKSNRFYYSGTLADSLMGRKLREVAKEREEYDKVIRTVGDSDYTDLFINIKFKHDIVIPDGMKKAYNPESKQIEETNSKKTKKLISKKKLRKMAYRDGITINGVHYVNYQRTSSKARVGNCMFIREDYFEEMDGWQNLGIPFSKMVKSQNRNNSKPFEKADIVSIRSYQSLIASSIMGELEIDPYSILLIDDVSGQDTMDCNVVKPFPSSNGKGTELRVIREPYTQKTDLWDGQSLLDSSIFKKGKYATKDKDGNIVEKSYEPYGFMLLRNHFFKSAAFNTNLQEYYKERFNDVENPVLKDMFGNEFDIEDIKMVTTPNSVKIFKFSDIICEYMIEDDKKSHLRELERPLIEKYEELRKAKQAVTTAKRKFTMLLNYDPKKGKEPPIQDDIDMAQDNLGEAEKNYNENCRRLESEIESISKSVKKSIKREQDNLTWNWYREQIKDQKFGVCKTEHKSKFGDKQQLWYQVIGSLNFDKEELWELVKSQIDKVNLMKKHVAWFKHFVKMNPTESVKDSMMLSLLDVNDDISRTKWYTDYRRFKISGIIEKLIAGRLQIKDSDFCTLVGNPYEMLRASCGDNIDTSILNDYGCYSIKYEDGEELYGMRAPHICTGNNALLKNTYRDEWKWFNLTENILVINLWGKGAFLSPKWNGSDTDSDAAFIGNNPIILEKVKNVQDYLIPINCVPQEPKFYEFTNENMAKVDGQLCNDFIGKICNLARDLQAMYWHLYNRGTEENMQEYLPVMYDDICLLEVLSNIAIDSAKRRYDCNIEAEMKKIKSRPYLKMENVIIQGNSIVFTEKRYKKSISENKIKEYERLIEKRNSAMTQEELDEINREIDKVLKVSKDHLIRPDFTRNLKSKPKKRKQVVNEKYFKLESPMDILNHIIHEKIVGRCSGTDYLPCFVDVLKPLPKGIKADYNRINAIKSLCLKADRKIKYARGKYKEGKLSYDEMYEEINSVEKDIINDIREREITPYDINVLIRKVYDIRPKKDAHGKEIKTKKGKNVYVDKRDQDIIKARIGGLLLKYVYAAHEEEFIKAIRENGQGTVSYVRRYIPKKKDKNSNEIFIVDNIEYEIYEKRAKNIV